MLAQIRNESGNKLRGKLDALSQVASTELGREWLLKALHPTDPTIGGVGIPDGTATDTVCLELTTTLTVGPSTLSVVPVTPWGADVVLTPHQMPGAIIPNGGAAAAASMDVRYPALSGVNEIADLGKLAGLAEAWRLTAQSVTIHLDANSTKDSGTVVAAQQVVKPVIYFPGMSTSGRIQPPIIMFTDSDKPTYTQLMSLPRAYQSNLREGLYMPLKLSSTAQHWMSYREVVVLSQESAWSHNAQGGQLAAAQTAAWPFYGVTGPIRSAVNNDITAYPISNFMGDTWGFISLSGIDPGSSVVFKFRSCIELKVQANSTYAPHLKPAAFPDAHAIDNYFSILRAMPDAYPADYNDAGRIMGVIGKAVRTVAPFLKFVPAVGPTLDKMAGPVSDILTKVGKDATEARKQYKAKNPNATKKQVRKATAKKVLQTNAAKAATALAKAT